MASVEVLLIRPAATLVMVLSLPSEPTLQWLVDYYLQNCRRLCHLLSPHLFLLQQRLLNRYQKLDTTQRQRKVKLKKKMHLSRSV